MLNMDIKFEEYEEDPRTPCKYGINCYQKNILHLSKYKHPPRKQHNNNDSLQSPVKKRKIGNTDDTNVNNGCSTNHHASTSSTTDNNNSNEKLIEDNITPVATNILVNLDEKDFIKSKFLVEMPPDFYSFWNFCKDLNKANPLMALSEIDLVLVGPFEVLAGKFENTNEKLVEEYVLHWRYFFDPPEFQTVIKLNDTSGYHLGYFRDAPDEMPVFLAYNFAKTDGTFTVVGDNLFAAVNSFLEFKKITANPFMKTSLSKYSSLIQKKADSLKYNLSTTTSKISSRNRKCLAKTFNRLGFIVPYDKHTQLGYRQLAISNKELQDLLNKFSGKEKDKLMIKLQEVLTYTNLAIDECDFGTGMELGLDILSSGVESLNSVVVSLLATCYRLLNREAFAVIIESHMKNRKKGFNLSII